MAAMTTSSISLSFPQIKSVVGIKSESNSKICQSACVAFNSPELISRLSLNTVNVGVNSQRQSAFIVRASELMSSESNSPPAGEPSPRLFVGNLPFSVDSKSLADVFQEVGVVDLVEVIYDRETGRSRGFAFVTMNSVEDAERAIGQLDGSEVAGRSIKVNFPAPKSSTERPRRDFERRAPSSRDNPNKLYIGNLSWGMDDESLQELFSEFGRVTDAKVVMDRETGRSRGFGFVTLSNANEVNEAVSALDGVEVDGRTIRVSLANAKRV